MTLFESSSMQLDHIGKAIVKCFVLLVALATWLGQLGTHAKQWENAVKINHETHP